MNIKLGKTCIPSVHELFRGHPGTSVFRQTYLGRSFRYFSKHKRNNSIRKEVKKISCDCCGLIKTKFLCMSIIICWISIEKDVLCGTDELQYDFLDFVIFFDITRVEIDFFPIRCSFYHGAQCQQICEKQILQPVGTW